MKRVNTFRQTLEQPKQGSRTNTHRHRHRLLLAAEEGVGGQLNRKPQTHQSQMLSSRLLASRQAGFAIKLAWSVPFSSDEARSLEAQVKANNAFKLFNLEEKLKIDEQKLKREMHKLQRAFHPDKIISSGRQTNQQTDRLSTIINHSFQTLKDPYKRAKYLLGLKLSKSPDEIEIDLDRLQLEPEFLNRMMDMRERIEFEEKFSLMQLANQVNSELEELITNIDKDFQTENYQEVLKGLGKLKFLANCQTLLRSKVGDDTF
jgi:Fe-S protein assembly co-chaperone HscB